MFLPSSNYVPSRDGAMVKPIRIVRRIVHKN
jgi:hypothetical protein